MGDRFEIKKPEVLTVTEVVGRIRNKLELQFPDVYLEGEISGFSRPVSGHMYFTLKDANAQLRAVMFKMQNRFLKFVPDDGMEVVARGKVSCYPPRGSLQIIIEYMEPKGAGALAAAFEQRKKDLAAKGYFDTDRKKSLPDYPFIIGIVTSPTAAAFYDALRIAFSRNPSAHIILSPTLVQGDRAAPQIARAMENLVEDGRADVICMIRGGGSAEDLWAFNELPVAEAIYNCPIPVVTGIGHEIDFTIADFCSDLRAPTPTAAAETVVPKMADILERIETQKQRLLRNHAQRVENLRSRWTYLWHRMRVRGIPTLLPAQKLDDLTWRASRAGLDHIKILASRVEKQKAALMAAGKLSRQKTRFNLQELSRRIISQSPKKILALRTHRLMEISTQMKNANASNLAKNREKLNRLESTLHALSPMKVLGRGYSVVRKAEDGRILRSPEGVFENDDLEILLAKGRLGAKVTSKNETGR